MVNGIPSATDAGTLIKTPAKEPDSSNSNVNVAENAVQSSRDTTDTVTVANANIEEASNRQTRITSAEEARKTASNIVSLIQSDPQQAAAAQGNSVKAEQANAALSLSVVGG